MMLHMLHYTGAKSRSSSKKLVHRRKGCLHGGTSRPSGCTVYTAVFIIGETVTGVHKTRLGGHGTPVPPLDDGPGAKYCDQRVCMSLRMFCGSASISTFHPNFTTFSVHVTCYLWPWLGPPLTAV